MPNKTGSCIKRYTAERGFQISKMVPTEGFRDNVSKHMCGDKLHSLHLYFEIQASSHGRSAWIKECSQRQEQSLSGKDWRHIREKLKG